MMNIIPSIQATPERKLIGQRLTMSLMNNKTFDLWRNFIPRRKEIQNNLNADMISMQVYEASYFQNFNPQHEFVKWATVEVSDFNSVPEGMEIFILQSGLYAVFPYKGAPQDAGPFFEYVFREWLPASEYVLDQRPHFEILGEKYKNGDPGSEEDIWIPIKLKQL